MTDDQQTSRRVLTQRLYKYARTLPYCATMEYTDEELRAALIALLLPIVGTDGMWAARYLLQLPDDARSA